MKTMINRWADSSYLMLIAILFSVTLLLAGCAGRNEETEDVPEKPDYSIGVEKANPPYYSADAEGNVSGIYVELMEALAQHAGFTYEFREMSAAEFKAGGELDCDLFLGTLMPIPGDDSYAQSETIVESGLCLLVKRGQGIRKTEHLRDMTIASRAETEEGTFARYLAASYDAETVVFQDMANALGDVTQGYSQAIVLDEGNAAVALQQNTDLKKLVTSERYRNLHRFTAAASRGIPDALYTAMEEMRADGTLDALLQNK